MVLAEFFRKNTSRLFRPSAFLFFFVILSLSFSQAIPVAEAAEPSCPKTTAWDGCQPKPFDPTANQCPIGHTVDGANSAPCGTGKVCCVSSNTGNPQVGGNGNPQTGGSQGNPQPGSSQTINFSNPLAFNTVEGLLDKILSTLRSIIVILSLVFIVIGALLYITSAGNDGQMKMAKGAITASMIGLAIGLAAPSFLKEIGTVLGWGAVNSTPVGGAQTLSEIAKKVLDFLLSIVGVLAIIMLVIGGMMYLTAAGDEDRIDSGKKIVKYSIIGILTALAALVIVSQIAAFFV